MHKIEKNYLKIVLVFACFCLCCCQDFEPEPLFPVYEKGSTTKTTPPSSAEISTTISTDRPSITTTSTTESSAIESTTKELDTTSSTDLTTTSTDFTITTSKPTWTPTEETISTPTTPSPTWPSSSTQSTPIEAYPTSAWRPLQKCYFRKQQSIPKFYWTCEGPKWLYSMECFQCCQSEYYGSAACYQVHYSHCEHY